MKNYILAAAFVFGLTTIGKSQTCSRKGQFNGGLKGKAEIVINKKGKMILKLSNDFKTNEGPDLGVYLSKTSKVVEGKSLMVKPLLAFEGGQRYVLKNIDMNEYNFVVIHCTEHNHHFGSAGLGKAEGESCEVK